MRSTMAVLSMGTLIAASIFGGAASATEPIKTREVVTGISDAFVPGGFSSESDAYVVTSGVFPNGCYSWKRAEVAHKGTNYHEVKTYATISEGMCLMVLVPFTKEVTLGKLEAGEHKLRFVNGDGTYLEKTMRIEQ